LGPPRLETMRNQSETDLKFLALEPLAFQAHPAGFYQLYFSKAKTNQILDYYIYLFNLSDTIHHSMINKLLQILRPTACRGVRTLHLSVALRGLCFIAGGDE
jgi:hypothetical protein